MNSETKGFEQRKRDHILLALDDAYQARGLSGLDRVRLRHVGLPELNLSEVTIRTSCLGLKVRTPFYVAGMTAGHAQALTINRILAAACQERGWTLGLGSQRRDLECRNDSVDRWQVFSSEFPDLLLLGNVGLSQLIEFSLDEISSLVESTQAHALVVHLNSLQEALQPEGTPRFKGGVAALKRISEGLNVPLIVKETGCGFSPEGLEKLRGVRLGAIDVSGLGGTHWGRIEGARSPENSLLAEAAQTFSVWGEPTVDSLIAARQTLPETEAWASGGVRTGLDAAKLVALGAQCVGFAKPALEAALEGKESLLHWMEAREYELRVALFCAGCASLDELRRKEGACLIQQS